MAEYNIGDKVIEDISKRYGIILKVYPPRRGRQLYSVNFGDGDISDVLEPDLIPSCELSDPFARCKSRLFGRYEEYSVANTTSKISNSNNSILSTLKASRTLFKAYQFKPLLKFLNSSNRRLLIADEVGLGKTIEAGHIMLEMQARNELSNALIICPKSLQKKWQDELWEKFGLHFQIFEKAREFIDELKVSHGALLGILNYEKLRPRKSDSSKSSDSSIISYLASSGNRFDLVLCDEAHKLRNSDTLAYKGAEVIMDLADSAIFMTATPIMLSEENLYNLLHLLDRNQFFDYQVFKNRIEENKPFVRAVAQLENPDISLSQIKNELLSSEVYSRFYNTNEDEIYQGFNNIDTIFSEDPIFMEIKNLFNSTDCELVRSKLMCQITQLGVMNRIFSRTRKREVITDLSQPERRPHLCKVDLNEKEMKYSLDLISRCREKNESPLPLITLRRQLASSVYAYLNTEKDLMQGKDRFASYEDSKVDKLKEIIEVVFRQGSKKIVVFALFKNTLRFLLIRLRKLGYKCLIIDGSVKDRSKVLDRFRTEPDVQILLSSEVGSEGLDMQFCDSMVNYDLPWNPMVVEQRIGRIDRFGQKSQIINIYNFVVAKSIHEKIYLRLLDRIGIFKNAIGDIEVILNAAPPGSSLRIEDMYNSMETELYTKDLSSEEIDKKIAEVEQAIENERINLEQLQEGLSKTFTSDFYFKDQINRILENKAFITENELLNYFSRVIEEKMPTCRLEKIEVNLYRFRIPISDKSALSNFLLLYGDESTSDKRDSLAIFKRQIRDKMHFDLTFNQEKAYENPCLIYVNAYHPLTLACRKVLDDEHYRNKTTFAYSLSPDNVLKKGDRYYLGIYELVMSQNIMGKNKVSSELVPIVFSIPDQKIVNSDLIKEHLYSRSQTGGKANTPSEQDCEDSIIDSLQSDFAYAISYIKNDKLKTMLMQFESNKRRNISQINEFHQSKINLEERKIESYEDELFWSFTNEEIRKVKNYINLAKGRIKQIEDKRQEMLKLVDVESDIKIVDKIVSINHITIQ